MQVRDLELVPIREVDRGQLIHWEEGNTEALSHIHCDELAGGSIGTESLYSVCQLEVPGCSSLTC